MAAQAAAPSGASRSGKKSVSFSCGVKDLRKLRAFALTKFDSFQIPEIDEEMMRTWSQADATKYFASGGWWFPSTPNALPPNFVAPKEMQLIDVIRACDSLAPNKK